jgi:hypothetical protein
VKTRLGVAKALSISRRNTPRAAGPSKDAVSRTRMRASNKRGFQKA